jgi:metal-responsive CopG/Arc/MetJ family transcriptional regulator
MNYTSIPIDTDLLEAVETRTDGFEERDEWIEDAIKQYLTEADLPDRPELDTDEYRRLAVERAIERKLMA